MGRGNKSFSGYLGHMTKIAAKSVHGKTLKNLLQHQKAYELETWNVALGTCRAALRQYVSGSRDQDDCHAIKYGKI